MTGCCASPIGSGFRHRRRCSRTSPTPGGRHPARELPDRIASTLAEGTQARRAEVWLVVSDRLELAASWPDRDPLPDAGGSPADRVSLEVRERGELFGVLTVVTHPGQSLSPVERRLFEGLAAQSGLMLRVSGLRTELERRLAELQQRSADLRRSRRELVDRQDAERQRLERNIHDGAQQEVIALLVNLRLVQTLLGRAPARAMGLLAQQAEATRATIRTLDELSRGLYPAVLSESGPVVALHAAAARSAIPVTVVAPDLPRLPQAVEAALYFSCLEALQNAAKHSAATRVSLEIRVVPTGAGPGPDAAAGGANVPAPVPGTAQIDRVDAEITDDGVGFAADERAMGTGLHSLRDRIESLHGDAADPVGRRPGHDHRAVPARRRRWLTCAGSAGCCSR